MTLTRGRILTAVGGIGIVAVLFAALTTSSTVTYNEAAPPSSSTAPEEKAGGSSEPKSEPEPESEIPVTHMNTPESVKAIYMTSWVAATPEWRERLFRLIERTELNSVVIDVKDYSGTISFVTDNPTITQYGAQEARIPNVKKLIHDLHERGIYVIGRITVFQDPHLAEQRPEIAVQRKDTGGLWKDKKGLSYIDPAAEDAWKYAVAIGKEAYARGFDELNYDYIRFPSDGNMRNAAFPVSGDRQKADVLETFFAYLDQTFADTEIVTSADLFGMTTTNTDDLQIGQVLERASPYFDYIAPMVYPSHYPPGFNGWQDPNKHPYEVIKYSMDEAVQRLKAATSSSPHQLRPWLQDFDYGGTYGATEVRAQIQAVYDADLDSWMLWDPGNKYTPKALHENAS